MSAGIKLPVAPRTSNLFDTGSKTWLFGILAVKLRHAKTNEERSPTHSGGTSTCPERKQSSAELGATTLHPGKTAKGSDCQS